MGEFRFVRKFIPHCERGCFVSAPRYNRKQFNFTLLCVLAIFVHNKPEDGSRVYIGKIQINLAAEYISLS